MNVNKKQCYRAGVFAIAYCITLLVMTNGHPANGLPRLLHGWGYALYFDVLLGLRLIQYGANWLLANAIKDSPLELSAAEAEFLDTVGYFILFVPALYVTAAIRPDLAAHPSTAPLVAIGATTILGVVWASAKWIVDRIEEQS
jgi:hypothetical protein